MAKSGIRQVRKRAEAWLSSPTGQAVPAALLAAHLRRTVRRTDWEIEGREAIAAALAAGPIVLAIWHGRLMSAAKFWDPAWGRFTTLSSQQYPGRLAGQIMRHFGLETLAMHDKRPSRADSLSLARAVKEGMSIGIAVDGPLGPARVAKTVPLDWARLTGRPVWMLGYSATRYRCAASWDRLVMPRAGGRGCILYREFGTVSKRLGADEMEDLRQRLQTELDAVTLEADRRMGHGGFIA